MMWLTWYALSTTIDVRFHQRWLAKLIDRRLARNIIQGKKNDDFSQLWRSDIAQQPAMNCQGGCWCVRAVRIECEGLLVLFVASSSYEHQQQQQQQQRKRDKIVVGRVRVHRTEVATACFSLSQHRRRRPIQSAFTTVNRWWRKFSNRLA